MGIESEFNACCYRGECRKQAAELERLRADAERYREALTVAIGALQIADHVADPDHATPGDYAEFEKANG